MLDRKEARARAQRALVRWAAWLARNPGAMLGRAARARLDGLERCRDMPGKCGPEPLLAARDDARKRRQEQRRPRRAPVLLAPFLAGPGAVPMPAPPKLRR